MPLFFYYTWQEKRCLTEQKKLFNSEKKFSCAKTREMEILVCLSKLNEFHTEKGRECDLKSHWIVVCVVFIERVLPNVLMD